MPLAARIEGLPSLAELVAGEPLRGSWWGHPAGKTIYAIATGLEQSVLTAKLVDGKVAFVDARLWPSLLRVVLDDTWRAVKHASLPRDARELWVSVESRVWSTRQRSRRPQLSRRSCVFSPGRSTPTRDITKRCS
jgi:hypothetical protein